MPRRSRSFRLSPALAMADKIAFLSQAVEALRRKDWVERREHLRVLQSESPVLYRKLIERLGPDEAVDGQNSARSATLVIALEDRPQGRERRLRQTTLERYFPRRR